VTAKPPPTHKNRFSPGGPTGRRPRTSLPLLGTIPLRHHLHQGPSPLPPTPPNPNLPMTKSADDASRCSTSAPPSAGPPNTAPASGRTCTRTASPTSRAPSRRRAWTSPSAAVRASCSGRRVRGLRRCGLIRRSSIRSWSGGLGGRGLRGRMDGRSCIGEAVHSKK